VTVEVEENINKKCEETSHPKEQLETVRKSGRNKSSPAWMKSGEYLIANKNLKIAKIIPDTLKLFPQMKVTYGLKS
jgi:hypothetical protein